jgi:hypothetical protein
MCFWCSAWFSSVSICFFCSFNSCRPYPLPPQWNMTATQKGGWCNTSK